MKQLKISKFHIRLIMTQLVIVLTVLVAFALVIAVKFSIDAKQAAYDEISRQRDALKRQIILNLGQSESAMNQLAYTYQNRKLSVEEWDNQVQFMLKQTPIITQIYLIDATGMQYYKSSYQESLGDRSDRDYFKKAIVGKANYSDVIESRSTQKPIVVYALPLYKNDKIVGVLGASIDLNFLSKLVWDRTVDPSESDWYGFIVDSKGCVIAHPLTQFVKNTVNVSKLEPVVSAINGNKGIGTYTFERQDKLVAFDYMVETNWGILVQIPKNTAYEHLYSFLSLLGITFGIIVAISIFIILTVAHSFKKPVAEIVNLIQVFQNQREIPKQCSLREDEFGLIRDAFITMAETVIMDHQELETRVQERTDELQKTLTALNRAQEQLVQSEKMAALGRMTNSFAHEINTPLGNALTVIDLTERTLVDFEESIVALQMLGKNDVLTGIVSELKEMAVMVRKQLITVIGLVETNVKTDFMAVVFNESDAVGLKEYLEFQLMDLQTLLIGTKHRLEFKVDIQESIDLKYKEKLTQILKMLIRNSIQHGFKDVESGLIQVVLEETASGLKLTYQDNGKSISEDEIKKTFEPYYKGEMSGEGNGLGLTIVYTLVVHFLNGTITCNEIKPKGLAYVIELPSYIKGV